MDGLGPFPPPPLLTDELAASSFVIPPKKSEDPARSALYTTDRSVSTMEVTIVGFA